jgi:hypothetical protein
MKKVTKADLELFETQGMNQERDSERTVAGGADTGTVRSDLEALGYEAAKREGIPKAQAKTIIERVLKRFDAHVKAGTITPSDDLFDLFAA